MSRLPPRPELPFREILARPSLSLLTALLMAVSAVAFGLSLREEARAGASLGEVNLAGSLRYRSLDIPLRIAAGRPWRANFDEMEAVFSHILGEHPDLLAGVSDEWAAYTGALRRDGRVSYATAEAMRQAANRLASHIERDGKRHMRRAAVGFAVGMGALLLALAASLRLLAHLNRLRRALAANEAYVRMTLDSAPIGMATVATDGQFVSVNRALCELLGRTEDELLATDFQSLTHPDDLDADLENVQRLMSGERTSFRMEKRYLRPDGQVVWTQLDASLLRDAAGRPLHFISQIQDITAARDAQRTLRHLALHDSLTGLPRRQVLAERIDQALAMRRAAETHSFAVLFIDLDGFKAVNDTRGHAAGDAVLRDAARRLQACLRATDTAARVGGDEFAVLLNGMVTERGAQDIAARIRDEMARPFEIDGGATVRIGASIGLTFGAAGYRDADALLHDADHAMYGSKVSGRGRVTVYAAESAAEAEPAVA